MRVCGSDKKSGMYFRNELFWMYTNNSLLYDDKRSKVNVYNVEIKYKSYLLIENQTFDCNQYERIYCF